MSVVSTVGLGFQATNRLTPENFEGPCRYMMPLEGGSTDPFELREDDLASHCEWHPMRSFVGAVVTAFGVSWCGDSSAQIPPMWNAIVRRLQEEERVADFLEPVTFNWDEDIYIARMAARRYSEQTHADY